MQHIVQEMLNEVEDHEKNSNISEELFTKLEQKVKKKFNEEVEKLDKSFKKIIEQLELQQQNLYQMMKEQIDKELKNLHDKKKKVKERDDHLQHNKTDLITALENMEIYIDEPSFNNFLEKKKKDIRVFNVLNEFIKPSPYFVYYMFKGRLDAIHADDYGSIKETLFKYPSLVKSKK